MAEGRQDKLEAAAAHRRAGRLAEAATLYGEVLAREPSARKGLYADSGAVAGFEDFLESAVGAVS